MSRRLPPRQRKIPQAQGLIQSPENHRGFFMPTVTSRPPAKPKAKAKPAKVHLFAFEEGQDVVIRHRPANPLTSADFDAIRKRMRENPKGDVVKSLRAFRDNRRG